MRRNERSPSLASLFDFSFGAAANCRHVATLDGCLARTVKSAVSYARASDIDREDWMKWLAAATRPPMKMGCQCRVTRFKILTSLICLRSIQTRPPFRPALTSRPFGVVGAPRFAAASRAERSRRIGRSVRSSVGSGGPCGGARGSKAESVRSSTASACCAPTTRATTDSSGTSPGVSSPTTWSPSPAFAPGESYGKMPSKGSL
jgi:hypothetical protein